MRATDADLRTLREIELSEADKAFIEERRRRFETLFRPHIQAVRESERITADDLAVRVNCRQEDKP